MKLALLLPMLQRKEMKHRAVNQQAQVCTVSKWQSWKLKPVFRFQSPFS